jgi:hypothetical protein
MYFSTVPPWCSTTERISVKNLVISCRMDSGSRRSPRFVDPSTSQKTTVTVFRASSASSTEGKGDPQDMQNSARAGLLWPHAGQSGMR